MANQRMKKKGCRVDRAVGKEAAIHREKISEGGELPCRCAPDGKRALGGLKEKKRGVLHPAEDSFREANLPSQGKRSRQSQTGEEEILLKDEGRHRSRAAQEKKEKRKNDRPVRECTEQGGSANAPQLEIDRQSGNRGRDPEKGEGNRPWRKPRAKRKGDSRIL